MSVNNTGFNYNKYKQGSGVGGTSTSNRRALKRASSNPGCCTIKPVVIRYSVTYVGNTSTGGSVPLDSSSYTAGSVVTILGNPGSLTKTNFAFDGWNLSANGSGTSYIEGNTFVINSNITLYAKWTPTYTVTYDGNSYGAGTPPALATYAAGATVTVEGNPGSLTREGFEFSGWNAIDVSGNSYIEGNTFLIDENITLYAVWISTVQYTVTYVGNKSDSGEVPPPETYAAGSPVTVEGNTGSLIRAGYNFAGWVTEINETPVVYNEGNIFVINSNITLTSNWSAIIQTDRTINYNGNGNDTGITPAIATYASGETVTIEGNPGSMTREGFEFGGWNVEQDGSGTTYTPDTPFVINSDIFLFAIWITGGVRLDYNAGTDGYGPLPASSGLFYPALSTQIVAQNTFSHTSGWIFFGWRTTISGFGTGYVPGGQIIMPASGSVTLYARWANTGQFT